MVFYFRFICAEEPGKAKFSWENVKKSAFTKNRMNIQAIHTKIFFAASLRNPYFNV